MWRTASQSVNLGGEECWVHGMFQLKCVVVLVLLDNVKSEKLLLNLCPVFLSRTSKVKV
jgi:hypothetical protein